MHRATRRTPRGWEAIAIAALVNAGLVLVLDHVTVPTGWLVIRAPQVEVAAAPPRPVAPIESQEIGLVTVLPPAIPLEAILGTGDRLAGTGRAWRPDTADLPGDRAADRGGGPEGGPETWTERRDRADDAALRKQVWTSDAAYLAARSAGRTPAQSPEAIARREERTYGDRQPRPAAAQGAAAPSLGSATGAGNDGVPIASGAEQALAGRSGASTPRRRDGATTRVTEAAYVDPGARAVDVTRRGATADDRAVAAASDQRRPDPFDLTPPRSGGEPGGEGVRGPAAPGLVTDGTGADTEASRVWAEAGEGGAPTWASRRDPYFLELFRKLDQRIVYPRDLAIALVSGRVIAQLTVRADGTIGEIGLHASSGYGAFDDQVTGALRAVGKLGPVPAAVLGGRDALRVRIPYTFKSPMIQ